MDQGKNQRSIAALILYRPAQADPEAWTSTIKVAQTAQPESTAKLIENINR
jgi:hypothetical protein